MRRRLHIVVEGDDAEALAVTRRSLAWSEGPVTWASSREAAEANAGDGDLLVTLQAGDVIHPAFARCALRTAANQPRAALLEPRARLTDEDGLLLAPNDERAERTVAIEVLGRRSREALPRPTEALVTLRCRAARPIERRVPPTGRNPRFTTSPATTPPTLGVLIPARDMEQYLEATLESIAMQTLPPDEVVVVDDGSSDATARMARDSSVVTRVLQGPSRGLAAARNAGAAHMNSDLILFLDADDVLEPDWVARAKGLAARYPAAALFVGVRRVIDDDGAPLWSAGERVRGWGDGALARRNAFGGIAGAVIRRHVFAQVGGFDETVRFAEDWELWQRLSRHVTLLEAVAPCSRVRHRAGSMMRDRTYTAQLDWHTARLQDAAPSDYRAASAQMLVDIGARAFAAGDLDVVRRLAGKSLLASRDAAPRAFALFAASFLPAPTWRWLLERRRQARRVLGAAADDLLRSPLGRPTR